MTEEKDLHRAQSAALAQVRLCTLTLAGLQRTLGAAIAERDDAVEQALACGVDPALVADAAQVSLDRRQSRWT